MSVGAGSIKRAAKAAEGKMEAKAAKAAEGKAAEAIKKEKAEEKAVSSKPVVKVNKSKTATSYVTYGIGQELPIHLM